MTLQSQLKKTTDLETVLLAQMEQQHKDRRTAAAAYGNAGVARANKYLDYCQNGSAVLELAQDYSSFAP